MHRPLSVRALYLALAFWLPLFMSGAEWVVRCPTHSGIPTAASHGASAGGAVAEHDHGADHSAPANHGTRHNCSCPGPGCCPSAVAVVPTITVPMAHVVAIHEAAAVSTLEVFSGESDYLLPFATAPPALALAPAALGIA